MYERKKKYGKKKNSNKNRIDNSFSIDILRAIQFLFSTFQPMASNAQYSIALLSIDSTLRYSY